MTEGSSVQELAVVRPAFRSQLDAAVRRVLADAGLDAQDVPNGPMPQTLTALARLVEAAYAGGSVPVDELPSWVGDSTVVDSLRLAWCREVMLAGDAVEPATMGRVFAAFDQVQGAIRMHPALRFVGRLSGREAARLVVEMAHDMRSTVGSIMFLSEALRSGRAGPLTATQHRQLGLIYSATLSLAGMVSNVVDLARGARGILDEAPQTFFVDQEVSNVVDLATPTAEEKGVPLEVRVPEIGPRLGHPAALRRVLLNLVVNALKFTQEGQVRVEVRRVGETSLEFSVSDTGRGMDQAAVDSLFNVFRARGATGGEYFSEAGLGLSMCQVLLSRMGSDLSVQSVVGRGSTFSFQLELPLASVK